MTAKQSYLSWVLLKAEISSSPEVDPTSDSAQQDAQVRHLIFRTLNQQWRQQLIDNSHIYSIRVWAQQLTQHEKLQLTHIPQWLTKLL